MITIIDIHGKAMNTPDPAVSLKQVELYIKDIKSRSQTTEEELRYWEDIRRKLQESIDHLQ